MKKYIIITILIIFIVIIGFALYFYMNIYSKNDINSDTNSVNELSGANQSQSFSTFNLDVGMPSSFSDNPDNDLN